MNDDYSDREQTQIKHFALRRYLTTASKIIGGWKRFSYVDCCAGPWESRSPDHSDTSFGIAVEVLKESEVWLRDRDKNPLFRVLLIEQSPDAFGRLKRFAHDNTSSKLPIEAHNWDFRDHTSQIIHYVSNPPSFAFFFIDPTGWTPAEVASLKPLLQVRPSEVLINFMSSFVVRFLNDEGSDMTEILGPDYRALRGLTHEEQEEQAVRRYCELIKREGGFEYVCALPVMKRDVDAFHFFLIYGTRHAKGVEVFKQVEKKTEELTHLVRAQRQQGKRSVLDLFAADVLYRREERYRRFADRSKREAKEAVERLLSRRREVLYDLCWAEALQYPTVYEDDLRQWLIDNELRGQILISGRRRPQEVLKHGSGHVICRP